MPPIHEVKREFYSTGGWPAPVVRSIRAGIEFGTPCHRLFPTTAAPFSIYRELDATRFHRYAMTGRHGAGGRISCLFVVSKIIFVIGCLNGQVHFHHFAVDQCDEGAGNFDLR